jgi:PilZ domain
MARHIVVENRTGTRYMASLPVRAEWDDEQAGHIVVEGTTENVGPEGVLIHLQRLLPNVGSRVSLEVEADEGHKLQVVTEVLRLERNAAHPLAALQLLDATDEWRGLVWEPAAPRVVQPPAAEEDDEAAQDDEETEH